MYSIDDSNKLRKHTFKDIISKQDDNLNTIYEVPE